ncbi:hypothetical protein [Brevundimonas sp.]|uniref:hypothetical protein n=1 Tax=Brevundimonas sp. TaxID=1871086 RepID=UPI002B8E4B5E|nr:hypothetical protein [Brevundimonas sp.]HWQ85750.1 hypothetical protein [Brevundimonas sp.]
MGKFPGFLRADQLIWLTYVSNLFISFSIVVLGVVAALGAESGRDAHAFSSLTSWLFLAQGGLLLMGRKWIVPRSGLWTIIIIAAAIGGGGAVFGLLTNG